MSYTAGTTVKLACTFEVDDVLTDPTAVSLKVKDPAGATTTYTWAGGTVTRASVGSFYKALAMASAGTWRVQWIGTGAAAGLVEHDVKVDAARVP